MRAVGGALGIVVVLAGGVVSAGCAPGRGADIASAARVVRVAPPDDDDDLREVIMRDLIVTFGAMEWSSAPGELAVRVDVLSTRRVRHVANHDLDLLTP